MKNTIILVGIIILISSCKDNAQKDVSIITNSDTIVSGNMFIAELYVSYNQSIFPSFYIFRDNDTLGLEIDSIKKCAIFRATYKTQGEKVFKGYVDYIDLQNKRKTEEFLIKYFVKP